MKLVYIKGNDLEIKTTVITNQSIRVVEFLFAYIYSEHNDFVFKIFNLNIIFILLLQRISMPIWVSKELTIKRQFNRA